MYSSLKPDIIEKLNSLIAIHGPLPSKPVRPPGSIGSSNSVCQLTNLDQGKLLVYSSEYNIIGASLRNLHTC